MFLQTFEFASAAESKSFLQSRVFRFIHSKEQIALALQKKKVCNARAQRIVEEFLDPVPVDKVDSFLSSVSPVNWIVEIQWQRIFLSTQSHMQYNYSDFFLFSGS